MNFMEVKMDILKTIMDLKEADLTIINNKGLSLQDVDKSSDLFEFYDKLLFHPLTEENIEDYKKIKNIDREKYFKLCNLLFPYYGDDDSIKNFIDDYN